MASTLEVAHTPSPRQPSNIKLSKCYFGPQRGPGPLCIDLFEAPMSGGVLEVKSSQVKTPRQHRCFTL